MSLKYEPASEQILGEGVVFSIAALLLFAENRYSSAKYAPSLACVFFLFFITCKPRVE